MMTLNYLLNPAKVGFVAEQVTLHNVSYIHEQENFLEVYYIKDDVQHERYIKKEDILIYETY